MSISTVDACTSAVDAFTTRRLSAERVRAGHFELLVGLFQDPRVAATLGGGEEAVARTSSSTNYGRWIVFGLGGTLAVVIVLATGGLTYAWMRGLGGLEPVDLRWGQTVRLASWARMPPAASHTPREFARELGARVPDLEDDIELLADAYVRHRYGREPIGEDEEGRLEQAWRAVRRRLLPRLFRSG